MLTLRDAKIEMLRRRAARDMLAFMRYCWWMPSPLRVGRHTRAICERLTRAVWDWKTARRPTYLVVSVPFRHGKSDMVSRALPAFFLGVCREEEPDVIMTSYASSLCQEFSDKVQGLVKSEAYQRVFPGMEIDPAMCAKDKWRIKGAAGTVNAVGLGGSVTGKGAHLLIVDDYCKNREEAESKGVRDKTWASFNDDFMTRLNGAAIVVVCATRWHEDDVIGRIRRAMEANPDYPPFEELVFPARREGDGGWDTLFPEMYDAAWYARQRASLGPYSAAALLDCDPKGAGEVLFRREWIRWYEGVAGEEGGPDPSMMNVMLFVDGAKSKRSTADYSSILAVGRGPDGRYYVLDWIHERLNLAEKIQAVIRLVAKFGGPRRVRCVWWEQVGPMSDVESLKIEMNRRLYHFAVRELRHTTNKDFRIVRLVVPFSNGDVVLPRRIVRQRREGGVDGASETVRSYDAIHEFVEDEYAPYTGVQSSIPHDDMLDTLADIMDPEVLEAFQPPADPYAGRSGDAPERANTGWRLY